MPLRNRAMLSCAVDSGLMTKVQYESGLWLSVLLLPERSVFVVTLISLNLTPDCVTKSVSTYGC